jgi:hypothetical protein
VEGQERTKQGVLRSSHRDTVVAVKAECVSTDT